MEGSLSITLKGEGLLLLPEKAIYWPARRALLVSDVHLGKAATFRAAGIPAPEGVTGATLARLTRLLTATQATRLIILGDLVHAAPGMTTDLCARVASWRGGHAETEMTLVTGNHDRRAGCLPDDWQITAAGEQLDLPPFVLLHQPGVVPGRYTMAGHLHPAVGLRGAGRERLRLPCFWFAEQTGVLPAFGDFTGVHIIHPREGDRVYAIAGDAVCTVGPSETSPAGRG